MSGDWSHPYPPGYREQLEAEARQASLPRDRKAAIVAELERLGKRTADEDRSGMETAGVKPGGQSQTVGVEPGTTGRHADVPASDDEGGH